MLRWRLLLGTLSIAALVGLCWLDHCASIPGIWLMPLVIVVSVLATRETLDLAALASMHPLRWTVYLGVLMVVSSGWLPELAKILQLPTAWHLVYLLFATWSLPGATVLVFFGGMWRYQRPGGNMANLAAGIFTLIYVGMLLSFAVQLRLLHGVDGVAALASWIIVVKMGDTGAYTVGRLIGRHKMAPLISPGKTIEGAVGALAFSCLGSWFALECIVPLTTSGHTHCPWWGWLTFGLLVGFAGMMGDLAESLLKRDVGVKDSSTWLPGFGGVLDMVDSLLLSAPVAWFCWATGLVGR